MTPPKSDPPANASAFRAPILLRPSALPARAIHNCLALGKGKPETVGSDHNADKATAAPKTQSFF